MGQVRRRLRRTDRAVRPGSPRRRGAPSVAPQDRGDDAVAVPVLHLAEAAPSRTNSILPLSPQTYLDRAATTREDIQSLAPVVDTKIRDEVEQADPGLDRDYADWLDQDCPRPKVRLLGKPRVWAQGSLPETPQVGVPHRSRRAAVHPGAGAALERVRRAHVAERAGRGRKAEGPQVDRQPAHVARPGRRDGRGVPEDCVRRPDGSLPAAGCAA